MQRLEFRCSISGDLTGLIAQYLDAHLGLKQASASCAAIVRDPKVEPGEALLPSGVTAELNHGRTESGARGQLPRRAWWFAPGG